MSDRELDLRSLLRDLDEAVGEHPLVEAGEGSEEAGEKFLLVRDGARAIGFRLEQVAGVVARPRCGRPPRAPGWLVGVFFWEGKMVPLLDWAVLSAEASEDSEEETDPVGTVERAVVLRLQELVFAVAVRDIVGVRRLRLVEGGVEPPDARGAERLGSRFSSVLRWAQEDHESALRTNGGDEQDLQAETEVRVVSAMGLLAHRSIARFANPGLIESLFVLDAHTATPPDRAETSGDRA